MRKAQESASTLSEVFSFENSPICVVSFQLKVGHKDLERSPEVLPGVNQDLGPKFCTGAVPREHELAYAIAFERAEAGGTKTVFDLVQEHQSESGGEIGRFKIHNSNRS